MNQIVLFILNTWEGWVINVLFVVLLININVNIIFLVVFFWLLFLWLEHDQMNNKK